MKKRIIIISTIIVLIICWYVFLYLGVGTSMYAGIPEKNNHQQVIEIFNSNQKEMEKINKIIIKPFKKSDFDGIIFSYSNSDKKYFSDEDWKIIGDFFQKTKPYSVKTYSPPNEDVVQYVFEGSDSDSDGFSIYYIENGFESGAYVYHKQKYKYFEKLNEDWFLGYGYGLGFEP